jgi:spermidine synthase
MVAGAVVFLIVALAVPRWDKMGMTLGLYSNVYNENTIEGFRSGKFSDELLFYKEGINAVITVRQDGDTLSYQANGKVEARATNDKPAETWSLLGHIPMLLNNGKAEKALLVGLGSGITLGAMETYPLKEIDVVEIEPAVVEAARYFYRSNNNALRDKRVNLKITDGRNFVATTDKRYDVIVSAVSDPWITGVSNLFTIEYFQKLSERLDDFGIVALWFQNYRIRPAELKIGLKTFAEVFPHVSLWFHYTNASDLVVIGSKEPHTIDYASLTKWFDSASVGTDLRRIGIMEPLDVMDLFLIGNGDLRRYLGDAPVNTDERPLLEFTLPKLQYMDPAKSVELVGELLDNATDPVAPHTLPKKWGESETKKFYFGLAKKYNNSAFRLDQALSLFRTVSEIDPEDKEVKRYIEGLEAELGISGKAVK